MGNVTRIGTKTPEEWAEHLMSAATTVSRDAVPAKATSTFVATDLFDRLAALLRLLEPDEALRLPLPRAINTHLRSGLYKGAARAGLSISMVSREQPTGTFLYITVLRREAVPVRKTGTLTCAVCGKEAPRYSGAQLVCSSNKGKRVLTRCQIRRAYAVAGRRRT